MGAELPLHTSSSLSPQPSSQRRQRHRLAHHGFPWEGHNGFRGLYFLEESPDRERLPVFPSARPPIKTNVSTLDIPTMTNKLRKEFRRECKAFVDRHC